MSVTEFIETTEALLDFVKTKLEAAASRTVEGENGEDVTVKDFSVEKFPGTNADDLFAFIPELAAPAAVIIYSGSDYANKPRRTARIGVIAVTETFDATFKNEKIIFLHQADVNDFALNVRETFSYQRGLDMAGRNRSKT